MRQFSFYSIVLSLVILFSMADAQAMQAQTAVELSCPNSEIPLTIRLESGHVWGKSFERVYYPEENDRKVSELIWQLKNVYMVGAVINAEPVSWLRINLGGWFAVNKGTGVMDDYDWVLEDSSEWTDWSHSAILLKRGIILDANLQGRLFEYHGLGFWAVGGFKFMNWYWHERGKFYIYSVYGYRDYYGLDGGRHCIDYEQWFYTPYAGVSLTYDYDRLHFSGYLNYSPLAWARGEDHHLLGNIVFSDRFDHVRYFGVGLRATFDVTEHFYVGAGFDFQQYYNRVGTTIEEVDGETTVYTESAGIEHFSHMISFTMGYRF